jgi:hypothetical protein
VEPPGHDASARACDGSIRGRARLAESIVVEPTVLDDVKRERRGL